MPSFVVLPLAIAALVTSVVPSCVPRAGQGTVPPSPAPTPSPTPAPTRQPLKPTPTPHPTPERGFLAAPSSVQVNEAFVVRAWLPAETSAELWADRKWKLGLMGWDRYCGCRTLTVTLNTPGARTIDLLLDGAWSATVSVQVTAAVPR